MSQLDLRANPIAWRSVVSVLLFVALWEIAARSHAAPAILLPPFSVVVEQLWRSTLDGTLVADLSLSLGRAICGLVVATVAGVILGLLMARNRAVEWLADPLVALGFPSPKIAFLPIFILWFGIESLSKILLVAFACIFPVIIGTYSAARAVSRLFVWSARSLGSGRSSVFLHNLPHCRACRSHHHIHSRNGGRRRRYGRDFDILAAVLRKPDGFCLHCCDVGHWPRVRCSNASFPASIPPLGRGIRAIPLVASALELRDRLAPAPE